MNKLCWVIIFLLGAFFAAGCSTVNWPGYEPVYVPLNTGVKDTSFLSSGELEIVHDMIKARSRAGDGTLKVLRLSMGLSFAAKQKAVETADPGRKEIEGAAQPHHDIRFYGGAALGIGYDLFGLEINGLNLGKGTAEINE